MALDEEEWAVIKSGATPFSLSLVYGGNKNEGKGGRLYRQD